MHAVLRRSVVIALLAGAAAAQPVVAAPHVRNGFCAGVGFGAESVSYTDSQDRRGSEGSGVMNARVGYALKPDLVLGAEFWGWSKSYDLSTPTLPVPVDVKLSAITACVTYFPGGAGFFMRMGAGLAYGRLDQTPPPSVTDVPALTETNTGVAVNFAPGYEWRIAQRFALGFQGDIVYLGLNGALKNAFGYGVNAQFNWYW